MTTVTLQEAQASLSEIIKQLGQGEELVITDNSRPVATLVGPSSPLPHPEFGRGKGKLVILSEDDEYLGDFENSGLMP